MGDQGASYHFGRQVRFLCQILCLAILFSKCSCSITAVSSIKECINDGTEDPLHPNGTACSKKLVVALTVQGDEGKAQYIQADIRRVHDSTMQKSVQLKTPVRITVTKSPVLINYRLYGVGYVNFNPHEEVKAKKGSRCRDDWFAWDHEVPCGFETDSSNEKIFDSQGFCCHCNMNDDRYHRGESKKCLNKDKTDVGHCLVMDPLYAYVFGLYPPQLVFNITLRIEQVSYSTTDGEDIYQHLDTLVLGPVRRIRTSNSTSIKGEYIADFSSDDLMPVLNHKYLLVPNTKKVSTFSSTWLQEANTSGLLQSIYNASEWLLIGKEDFDFSGYHCNKIGVSYTAFKHQSDGCSDLLGSCLQGQPKTFWEKDKENVENGFKARYSVHAHGRLHSVPHSNTKETDYQLNFIAQKRQRSLITISMEADNLKFIINKSPARIVDAFVESFEALSTNGILEVYVQNLGTITAAYELSVSHCSSGIDWIPSQSLTLDPGEETNITFIIHSFNAIGKINRCDVELLDQSATLLDNMTIVFQTSDTCFCYGYCGCSCGNNISECPPPPEYHSPDDFNPVNLNFGFSDLGIEWLDDVSKWMKSYFGGIILFAIIIIILLVLGFAKVGLMIIAGQVACPAAKACCSAISTATSACLRSCCACFSDTALNCCWKVGVAASGKKDRLKYIGREDLNDKDALRPVNCDGMCRGAKKARTIHRKKLRMMKRQGARATKMTAWWEKPYTCTCVVKKNMDIIEILKGLFFFIYCPLLPLWWGVEFFFEWIQRRQRKTRRMAEYRKLKKEKQKRREETYLMVDQYSRGMKAKKKFDAVKSKKSKKSKEDEDKDDEDIPSDGESAKELGLDTDTTDTDEAGDIDELLHPDYPVYFNFAGVTDDNRPSSLISPGTNFSISGQLKQSKKKVYIFSLGDYTHQVMKQGKKKMIKITEPFELDPKEFTKVLKADVVQLLVTIKPLFTCINDKPKIT